MPSKNTPPQAPGLHIFKPGTHTAMGGQTLAFSESDLQACARAYDPTLHEAPIVVGHPATDAPAYGWIKSLEFSDGLSSDDSTRGLHAMPAQVNPEFADMVAAGAFKKISASFYSPGAPANPKPGVYYLRHVGFLGAQAPAIKGLRNPSFAAAEEGVVEFSEWDDATNANLWRNLREWMIGTHGTDVADKVLPAYDVRALELGAQDEIRDAAVDAAAPTPAFTETSFPTRKESTVTEEEAAQLRTQAAQQAARIADLEAAAAAASRATLHAAHTAFCEAQPGVLPAWREVAVATLDHFAAQTSPVEFGEGDARAPLAEKFKAFLTALPPPVQFGEAATRDRAAAEQAEGDEDAQFGESADPARLAQHKAIRAHMAEHKTDYATAARAVIK